MESKRHFFYVLLCQDNTLYGGYTVNLEARLEQHNLGKGAKYTRPGKRRPVQMIYAEEWPSQTLAMRAEYHFKQLTRAKKLAYLKKHRQADIHNQGWVLRSCLEEEIEEGIDVVSKGGPRCNHR